MDGESEAAGSRSGAGMAERRAAPKRYVERLVKAYTFPFRIEASSLKSFLSLSERFCGS